MSPKKGTSVRAFEDLINQSLGEELVVSLSSRAPIRKEGLSSGSCRLNVALSGSPFVGYVWGRVGEIYGPEGGGKTTLALHTVAECQKLKLPVLYVDAEHALDVEYAQKLGVRINSMSLCQPGYGEQGLEVVKEGIKAGYRLIVIDSVAALVPLAELEGEIGDAHMGKQARMMGQALRSIVGAAAKASATILFINQIRMKLGTFFGNPETTPGGQALKFYATYRLEVRSPRSGADKGKSLTGEKVERGIIAKIKVVKNKVYPPYRTAEVYIEYGKGIDRVRDLVSYIEAEDLLGGRKLVVGKRSYGPRSLKEAIRTSVDVRKAIFALMKKHESAKEKESSE